MINILSLGTTVLIHDIFASGFQFLCSGEAAEKIETVATVLGVHPSHIHQHIFVFIFSRFTVETMYGYHDFGGYLFDPFYPFLPILCSFANVVMWSLIDGTHEEAESSYDRQVVHTSFRPKISLHVLLRATHGTNPPF